MICEWIGHMRDFSFLRAACVEVMFRKFKDDEDVDIAHKSDEESELSSYGEVTNLNTVEFDGIENSMDEYSIDIY